MYTLAYRPRCEPPDKGCGAGGFLSASASLLSAPDRRFVYSNELNPEGTAFQGAAEGIEFGLYNVTVIFVFVKSFNNVFEVILRRELSQEQILLPASIHLRDWQQVSRLWV